jgi:MFS family permease
VSDRRILYAAGFLRSAAVALSGVLLGFLLPRAGLSEGEIGGVVAAGLAGGATAVLLAGTLADRIGRRRFLLGVAALSVAGTAAAAFLEGPGALGAAAFLGMLNGMGRDRGAAAVVEQALLPATTDDRGRTPVLARYTFLQDAGRGLGNLAAGLPGILAAAAGLGEIPSLRAGLLLCALLQAPALLLYARLSPALVPPLPPAAAAPRPGTPGVVARLCALFAIDSVAGGFLASTLLTVIFQRQFGASDGEVAVLFAAASVLNAFSHLGAAWLAARIGLVNTMVFTHVPGSLLLVTVAYAPSFPVAAVLFLLREGLVEMDVPTRQSYVLAVVAEGERTAATAATSLVRVAGWGLGSLVAGSVMAASALTLPLVISAAMKIGYDGLLWVSFRKLRPPEERL